MSEQRKNANKKSQQQDGHSFTESQVPQAKARRHNDVQCAALRKRAKCDHDTDVQKEREVVLRRSQGHKNNTSLGRALNLNSYTVLSMQKMVWPMEILKSGQEFKHYIKL